MLSRARRRRRRHRSKRDSLNPHPSPPGGRVASPPRAVVNHLHRIESEKQAELTHRLRLIKPQEPSNEYTIRDTIPTHFHIQRSTRTSALTLTCALALDAAKHASFSKLRWLRSSCALVDPRDRSPERRTTQRVSSSSCGDGKALGLTCDGLACARGRHEKNEPSSAAVCFVEAKMRRWVFNSSPQQRL